MIAEPPGRWPGGRGNQIMGRIAPPGATGQPSAPSPSANLAGVRGEQSEPARPFTAAGPAGPCGPAPPHATSRQGVGVRRPRQSRGRDPGGGGHETRSEQHGRRRGLDGGGPGCAGPDGPDGVDLGRPVPGHGTAGRVPPVVAGAASAEAARGPGPDRAGRASPGASRPGPPRGRAATHPPAPAEAPRGAGPHRPLDVKAGDSLLFVIRRRRRRRQAAGPRADRNSP